MPTLLVTYRQPARLREDVSEPERRAYRRRLLDVLERADALEGEVTERAIGLVKDLQRQVLGELSRATSEKSYGVFWLKTFQGELARLTHEMAWRYQRDVGELLEPGWKLGAELVDQGLAGRFRSAPLPRLTPQQLNVAADFSADLIRSLEDDVREKVNQHVRTAVLTGVGPHQLAKQLAVKVTTRGTPFRSAAVRAEVIARTEVARLQGLGAEHRMRQVAREYPDGGMKLHLLVAEVNGWPCTRCEEVYAQGPWEVDDPARPMVPIHPCCRCKLIPYFEGLTVVPDPTDGERVAGEIRQPTGERRDASVVDADRPDDEEPDEFEGPGAASKRNRRLPPNVSVFDVPQGFRAFTTADEMEEWVSGTADEWSYGLDDTELDAARKWKGELYKGGRSPKWYEAINAVARRQPQSGLPPEMLREARRLLPHLDSAIQKGILEEDIIAYHAYGELRSGEFLELGYTAVTLSRAKAERWARRFGAECRVAEVRIPRGTRVGHVDRLGVNEGQLELLLARRSQFRVLDTKLGEPGQPEFVLMELTRDGARSTRRRKGR